MVFQGLDQQQAETIWRPFLDWLARSPQDFSIESEPWIATLPARRFWDPGFLKGIPGIVLTDDRPGAPKANVFWAGNLGEAGQVLHGYQSAWLPASLLEPECRRLYEIGGSLDVTIGMTPALPRSGCAHAAGPDVRAQVGNYSA